ncbi:uncharacterized protein L203_104571 [Cryptococcus depauperatus CBS 7841]|uniref:Sulfatase-modifying factor enzyme domain-containing protein n=1 Tax=Cryptococcus depauperatus CBS 7841 TaxID=1295531 RepID=A0AAJ8JVQ8_9TREE
MTCSIFTLPSGKRESSMSTDSSISSCLRLEIEAGLRGTSEPTMPGSRAEDKEWAYTKSVPTVVLYDEKGLRLYDKITAEAPEYYLFNDELNLLKTHGAEIVRFMMNQDNHGQKNHEMPLEFDMQPGARWKPGRWGDAKVGKWNEGVNGEIKSNAGMRVDCDIVELGAGALRKTAHLLRALSFAVDKDTAKSQLPPITYYALDLSYPELDRVLSEMQEAIGHELEGKVACLGLHGDYDAGLQFIREGKLSHLRQNLGHTSSAEAAITSSSAAPRDIPTPIDQPQASPTVSPVSVQLVTPRDVPSPLLALEEEFKHRQSDTNNSSPDSSDEIWKVYPYYTHARDAIRQTTPASDTNSPDRPLHFAFLGSSLGNFDRTSAPTFLKSLPIRPGDTLLLGLDGRPSPGAEGKRKLEVAYNDPHGHTKRFEEHGWEVIRDEMGIKADVEFVGRYNEQLGRHEAYFKSKDQEIISFAGQSQTVKLEKGELLHVEWSYKYSLTEALSLFIEADLRVINLWKAPRSEYRLWLLERPYVRFITAPSNRIFNSSLTTLSTNMNVSGGQLEKVNGIPKWDEWLALWKLWDHITLDMIPEELLHQKPIDLRHICLFYLGHIPTFLDIHLTRMTKGKHTWPEHFKDIFERGIDPDVDDPTNCHSHSEVPVSKENWPTLSEILDFRDRVRKRLFAIYTDYASGKTPLCRHDGRVLFMVFEHEAMHAETILYMLAQSPLTKSPSVVKDPVWDILVNQWAANKSENKVLEITGGEITLGHDDVEEDDKEYPTVQDWENHEFGWDNESPKAIQQVKPFRIDSLPVTNNEYRKYLQAEGIWDKLTNETAPASWINTSTSSSPEWQIRTFYGSVSFEVGGNWPLMASKIEIDGYAKWKGGRLPTEAELRKLWESEQGPRVMGAVNNVGVKNWHPIPPTNTTVDNAGSVVHGHNGGVWEWTDSTFYGYEGFVSSQLYPGYSSDFFDGKHYVVLGGSYATIPQIAGRKSFRNWYQANYRYSFIGGRVAYTI